MYDSRYATIRASILRGRFLRETIDFPNNSIFQSGFKRYYVSPRSISARLDRASFDRRCACNTWNLHICRPEFQSGILPLKIRALSPRGKVPIDVRALWIIKRRKNTRAFITFLPFFPVNKIVFVLAIGRSIGRTLTNKQIATALAENPKRGR